MDIRSKEYLFFAWHPLHGTRGIWIFWSRHMDLLIFQRHTLGRDHGITSPWRFSGFLLSLNIRKITDFRDELSVQPRISVVNRAPGIPHQSPARLDFEIFSMLLNQDCGWHSGIPHQSPISVPYVSSFFSPLFYPSPQKKGKKKQQKKPFWAHLDQSVVPFS